MLFLLSLTGLLQICVSGNVYVPSSPVVSTRTSEAHGPLARLALGSARVSHPLQYYPAPIPLTLSHAPVVPQATAYALPVPRYFVQKVVDVPTAKVATARLQVRRPAIQKHFYDIEQHTVIRPVGSAVVELEEPLSKNYVTPFTQQLVYPVSSYPFGPYAPIQVPVQSYPPSFTQQPQFVGQRPILATRPPPQQTPSYPLPPQQAKPQPPTNPPVISQPPQQFPLLPQPTRPDDAPESSDFDLSDTVVIDNPDFDRSASLPRALPQGKQESLSPSKTEGNDIQETSNNNQNADNNYYQFDKEHQDQNQEILDEFQNRQLLRMFMRNQPILQTLPQLQQILPLQPAKQFEQVKSIQLDDVITHDSPSLDPIDHDTTSKTSSESTSTAAISEGGGTEAITEEYTPKTDPSLENVSNSTLSPQESVQRIQVRQYSSEEIPSVRYLSPEQAQENHQKLIELLTGQGEISEIDLTKSAVGLSVVGDSGVIRGRVLSVTSAPPTHQTEAEKVSRRRVVVSRPIQTLEEVDVHQPFTKVERVAVHEPALLETVYPHVTRVSTAVPLFSPTPTPVVYQ